MPGHSSVDCWHHFSLTLQILLLQLLFFLPQQWKTLGQRTDTGVQSVLGKYNNAFFLLLIADSGISAQYHCWKGRTMTSLLLSDFSSPASSSPDVCFGYQYIHSKTLCHVLLKMAAHNRLYVKGDSKDPTISFTGLFIFIEQSECKEWGQWGTCRSKRWCQVSWTSLSRL